MIYNFIEPQFEAFSTLRIEPVQRSLYEANRQDSESSDTPYLQTQVALITCDRVLGYAISDPEIANLTEIKAFRDPRNDLRSRLSVEIVPDTDLIRVALALPDGKQAASIVNAVVYSYLDFKQEFARSASSTLRANLVAQRDKLRNEIKEKQAELSTLWQKESVDAPIATLGLDPSGNENDSMKLEFSIVPEEQSQQVAAEIINVDLNRIKAQAILETRQAMIPGENERQSPRTLGEQKLNVTALLEQKKSLAKFYDRLKVERKVVNDDAYEAGVVKFQLDNLLEKEEQVKEHLEQLEFEATRETYRVQMVDRATAPKVPTENKRFEYMAIAPWFVLFLVLAECLLKPLEDDSSSATPRTGWPRGKWRRDPRGRIGSVPRVSRGTVQSQFRAKRVQSISFAPPPR